jgi:four helix bundle protein
LKASLDTFLPMPTDPSIPAEILKQRTKQFAVRIIRLFREMPRTEEAKVIGRQVLRSGTSVAANYRAVCRARSKAEFIAKIGVVVEEIDETVFWFELMVDSGIFSPEKMSSLLKESNELLAIFAASKRTAISKSKRLNG